MASLGMTGPQTVCASVREKSLTQPLPEESVRFHFWWSLFVDLPSVFPMTAMMDDVEWPASFSFCSGDVSLSPCQQAGNNTVRCVLDLHRRRNGKFEQFDSHHDRSSASSDLESVALSPSYPPRFSYATRSMSWNCILLDYELGEVKDRRRAALVSPPATSCLRGALRRLSAIRLTLRHQRPSMLV